MRNYLQYIKEHHDLDPYGEEDWDDLGSLKEMWELIKNIDALEDKEFEDDKIKFHLSKIPFWGRKGVDDENFDFAITTNNERCRISLSKNNFVISTILPLNINEEYLVMMLDILIREFSYFTGMYKERKLNENHGISSVVHSTARKIYKEYNLEKFKIADRSKLKDIVVDTSKLDDPFNKMKITIKFLEKENQKLRGGVDRVGPAEFNLYIYHSCKNIGRTIAHELTHIHQIFLRGKHFKTNKEIEPILRKSEQSPSLMSAFVKLRQKKVKTKEQFIEEINKLSKYKKCKEILADPAESKENKKIVGDFIKKVDKMYPLFVENAETEKEDIKINVQNKNYLVDNLIEKLSLVVKKRKTKSFRIKSINGYINKQIFTGKGFLYETKFEIILNNKDVLVGEFYSKNHNIIIKVNDEIIYDLEFKTFDNDTLVEKMISEYIKYLKNNKFVVNEQYGWNDDEWWGEPTWMSKCLTKGSRKDALSFYNLLRNTSSEEINKRLTNLLKNKWIDFMENPEKGYDNIFVSNVEYENGIIYVTEENGKMHIVDQRFNVFILKTKPEKNLKKELDGIIKVN